MSQKSTLSLAKYQRRRYIFLSAFFIVVGILTVCFGALATSFPTTPQDEEEDGKSKITVSPKLDAIIAGTENEAFLISGTQGVAIVSGAGSADGSGSDCFVGLERVPIAADSLLRLQVGYSIGGQEVTKKGATYICTESNAISWAAGETKYWEDPSTRVFVDTDGRLSINTEYSAFNEKLEVTDGNVLTDSITSPAAEIGSISADTLDLNGDGDIEKHLTIHMGLNVGSGGIKSDGPLSASSGTSYIGGSLGIKDTQPAYDVEINGDVHIEGGGYQYDGSCDGGSCASDIRLKADIEPLSDSLSKITQLQPSTFFFLDEVYGKGLQTGLIAQEVEQVFPEWVQDSDDGHKGILYGIEMEMYILKAIQELSEKYEIRKEALVKENARLKARLEEIKNTAQQK